MTELEKLAKYVESAHPGCRVRKTGRGVEVVDSAGGPPPKIDQAAFDAWLPPAADPDKAPAPSLEIRDYKGLLAAIDAATTVAGVKAVFRQYLLKRAGL